MFRLFILCLINICACVPAPVSIPSDDGLFKGGFFQGDIAGVDPFELNDRSATVKLTELWPEGIVYYKIDKSLTYYTKDIREAMDEYESKTCIKFRLAISTTVDYLNIAYMNGCWSKPGHRGGKQDLSLGDGCLYKGTIIHELGHALGFFHEQSRSDRDEYLEVIWENIEKGQEPQFIKLKYYDNNFLGEKFDYKSIMLYDETTFSKDGESPTIRVLQPGVVIGKVYDKVALSEVDVRKVNKLYQCNGLVRPTPPQAPDQFCDLEVDDCGITNRYGSTSFQRKFMTLGGRTGTIFVVDDINTTKPLIGLATPNWHLYGKPEGCFSFDYYFDGDGMYDFHIFKSIERVFDTDVKSPQWKTLNLPVYAKEGEIRFTINGYIDRDSGPGIWAMDNFTFKLSPCSKI